MHRVKIPNIYLEAPIFGLQKGKDGLRIHVPLVLVVSLGEVVDDSLVCTRVSMLSSPLAQA